MLLRRYRKQNENETNEPKQKAANAPDVTPPKKEKQKAAKKPSAK